MTVGEIRRILGRHCEYDSESDAYYITDYHPYWHGNNPEFNDDDGLLLDFKKGYDTAVRHFYNKLSYRLNKLYEAGGSSTNIWLCPVPSHDPNNKNSNVYDLISRYRNFPSAKILKRTRLVDKLASGGNRDVSVHTNSIVSESSVKLGSGAVVILVDDVITTGNSIKACKSILMKRTDVSSVVCVVIAKTKNKYSSAHNIQHTEPIKTYSSTSSKTTHNQPSNTAGAKSIINDDQLEAMRNELHEAQRKSGISHPKSITRNTYPESSEQRKQSAVTGPKKEPIRHEPEPKTKQTDLSEPVRPVVTSSTQETKKKQAVDKTIKIKKYQNACDRFRYGFFHPWVLLVTSVIALIIVAIAINRRLYYLPLTYMFMFTPMALLWMAPVAGILTSILSMMIKRLAFLAESKKKYMTCLFVSRINRLFLIFGTLVLWISLIGMLIWYNLGIERSVHGPWEYRMIQSEDFKSEQDTYFKHINWLIDAHRCPRCHSRNIDPTEEYDGDYVPEKYYEECQDYFGGCRNTAYNPLHECRNCGLIFKFK